MKGETFLAADIVLMNGHAIIRSCAVVISETRPEGEGCKLVQLSQQSTSWWQVQETPPIISDLINEPSPA